MTSKKTFTVTQFLNTVIANGSVLEFSTPINIFYPVRSVTINCALWSTTANTYRSYLVKSNLIPPNVLKDGNIFSVHENSNSGPIIAHDVRFQFENPLDINNQYTFSFHSMTGAKYTSAGGTDVIVKLVFECEI